MTMKHVFLFEVVYSPKGMPFKVRVHDHDLLHAQQRVQRMHPLSTIRFLNKLSPPAPTASISVGELKPLSDWQARFDAARARLPARGSYRRNALI
jgi:hypothetical protein